ncbi:MAG: DUF262 domain-containing protein [Bacteroidetes bacterium]|nr:DUF262 domain-containing protein [Bacteroidota bacterium]
MENKILVKPDKSRLTTLIETIKNGEIQVPVFQRDFVWKPEQIKDLFDSILKGYPIGSLLLWNPDVKFKIKTQIGPYKIKSNPKNLYYVLDGYQRITSLFSSLVNPKDVPGEVSVKEVLKYTILFNAKENEFTINQNNKDNYYIQPFQLINTFEYLNLVTKINSDANLDLTTKNKIISNLNNLSKVLYEYEVPYIEIKGGDIRSAVEIFSRINSTGTEISQDFMLSALAYNEKSGFLLSNEITKFIEDLDKYNFHNLKRDTVLNCIASATNKIYFDVKIEELLKLEIQEVVAETFKNINIAIEFLYKHLKIIDYKFLPYPTQLIFITEFFKINQHPSQTDLQNLESWFWITSYSNYFTTYSLSQQRLSFIIFKDFAKGLHPTGIYKATPDYKFTALEFPNKINLNSVRTKTLILFILNQTYPFILDDENKYIYNEKTISGKKDRRPGNILLTLKNDSLEIAKFDLIDYLSEDVFSKVVKFSFPNNYNKEDTGHMLEEFISDRNNTISDLESLFIKSFEDLALTYNISFRDEY